MPAEHHTVTDQAGHGQITPRPKGQMVPVNQPRPSSPDPQTPRAPPRTASPAEFDFLSWDVPPPAPTPPPVASQSPPPPRSERRHTRSKKHRTSQYPPSTIRAEYVWQSGYPSYTGGTYNAQFYQQYSLNYQRNHPQHYQTYPQYHPTYYPQGVPRHSR